jgi:membrane fusion protein, multidrug efflux system
MVVLVRAVTMKVGGTRRQSRLGKLIALLIIAGAIGFGLYVLQRQAQFPSSDDASIDADVVHIASQVGGRIVEIPVAENDHVAKGDLLFQIDKVPFQLVVAQTQADLELAEAALDTQRRVLSTQRSAAAIAGDQVKRAVTNLDLATRTVERLRPLGANGYVPAQQLDQAQAAQRDAATSLQQAREQETAALAAIDTLAGAEATVRARQAGLTVATGEMIAPSQTLFTLVATDEWFAVANFRETDLRAIAAGDCATVFSMIDRGRPIKGVVQGIGAGVLDTDRVNLPRSVPYVERSLNWVKVAQRFPVRMRLEDPPERLMRLGATAVVEVKHGDACK